MTCALNKCAKINACIGIILIVVGLIMFLAAHLSASAGFEVETSGGGRTVRVDVDNDDWWGIYIAASEFCEDDFLSLTSPDVSVTHVASNTDVSFVGRCDEIYTNAEEHWEADHDPPLRNVGSFHPADDNTDCGHTDHCSDDDVANNMCVERCREGIKLHGAYSVQCSVNCWVVDIGEEIGEAIGGLMAAIGLVIVMAILFIIGGILICVACCCCCQGPDKAAQPPAVQGQVVGAPVVMAQPVEGQA